jgi:NitT/TauT family transport system substrate-binding protein
MKILTKFMLSAVIIVVVILASYFNSELSSTTESITAGIGGGNKDSNGVAPNRSDSWSGKLRLGYFPNLNHAQVIIGLANDHFQRAISEGNTGIKGGEGITIEEYVFGAGPSAIEALLAGQIDVAYVGPNPAINGYLASKGENIRIISGATSGGALFVVRNDSGISTTSDLGGKKFASPQLGSTQDVALRKYIRQNGFDTVENGGNVTVIPVKPSEVLTLMLKNEIDGAWVPEPWGARLIKETNSRILVDERDLWSPDGSFVTTNVIVNSEYLQNNPEVIKRLIEAHVDETVWINETLRNTGSGPNVTSMNIENQNSGINTFIQSFNTGLERITGNTIPEDELRYALQSIEFTYDPIMHSLVSMANHAYELGLTGRGDKPDLGGIYDLRLLNQVLEDKNLTYSIR